MAEKYNLPGPGTRPLFFRLPRGRGVVTGTGYPFAKPARRPPVTWFNDLGRRPGVRNWHTPALNNTNCN